MSSYPEAYPDPSYFYEARDLGVTALTADLPEIPLEIPVVSTLGFPDQGVITIVNGAGELTSDRPEVWSCSFHYKTKTETSFKDLTLTMGDFTPKYKGNLVCLNVISDHHNRLASEVLSIERIVGEKGSIDPKTIVYRSNRLGGQIRAPRAFFISDPRLGFAPLKVQFIDMSSRGPTKWIWDFGDGNTSFDTNPVHTFVNPGVYTVRLTVFNDYGSTSFQARESIRVMDQPPDEPSLEANPRKVKLGQLSSLVVIPKDSTPKNRFVAWDWNLPSDTSVISSPSGLTSEGLPGGVYRTRAPVMDISFSKGGFFDISVIARTVLGGYRGVLGRRLIECIEDINLWDLRYLEGQARVLELGLISKTFKDKLSSGLSVTSEFLSTYDRYFFRSNSPYTGILVQREHGEVELEEYQGFSETWSVVQKGHRPWPPNFLAFEHNKIVYLLFGLAEGKVNPEFSKFDLSSRLGWQTDSLVGPDLSLSEMTIYTATSWYTSGSSVYLLGRSPQGPFDSFFQFSPVTSTIISVTPPSNPPSSGSGRGGIGLRTQSGKLVTLRDGIYLFGPVGGIAKYDPITDVWSISQETSSYFNSNLRVSAGGADNLAFVETYGNRYFSYFDLDTSLFKSLTAPSGLPIEKGVY